MEKVIIVGNVYIDDSLANFLKKEGVLQEFVEESRAQGEWSGLVEVTIADMDEGFFWDESKKGHWFWSKLEEKYCSK